MNEKSTTFWFRKMVLVLSTVLLSCWTILTMQLKSSARTTRKPFPSVQQFQGGFVVWGLWSELHHIEFLHLNKEWPFLSPFLSPRHIRWSKQICSAGVSILTGKGKDVTGKKTKSTKMLNFQVSYSLSVRSCIPNWRLTTNCTSQLGEVSIISWLQSTGEFLSCTEKMLPTFRYPQETLFFGALACWKIWSKSQVRCQLQSVQLMKSKTSLGRTPQMAQTQLYLPRQHPLLKCFQMAYTSLIPIFTWWILWWNLAEKGSLIIEWLLQYFQLIRANALMFKCWVVWYAYRRQEINTDLQAEQEWRINHAQKCKANFKGLAPSMETEGVKWIFERTEWKHKLNLWKNWRETQIALYRILWGWR